jgi:hypothetical protein
MKKILLVLCPLVAAFGADNVRFTLHQAASLNGTPLKPGDYRIQVDGGKATLRVGKTVIESPVKVEAGAQKFKETMVSLEGPQGAFKISEIDIGGSTTRIVFSGTASGQ